MPGGEGKLSNPPISFNKIKSQSIQLIESIHIPSIPHNYLSHNRPRNCVGACGWEGELHDATLRDCSQKKPKVRMNVASLLVCCYISQQTNVFPPFSTRQRVSKKGELTVRKEKGKGA